MKKLYWRPRKVSTFVLVMVALVAVAGVLLVENVTIQERQKNYKLKLDAARLAAQAYDVVKAERVRLKHPVNLEYDPAGTGMLGDAVTSVTTNPGYITSKRTSANPNFAAVVVQLFKRAGLNRGDVVAIGMTGSFPAMNINVLAAVHVLGLKPIIITSVGSSQWGANFPDFMWPDIERILVARNILPYPSEVMTRGGIDDNALGLEAEAVTLIDDSIVRSGRPALVVSNYKDSFEKRMEIYDRVAGGEDNIRAYINIGGGTVSLGRSVGKKIFTTGLNTEVTTSIESSDDSVMMRFAQKSIPVLHFSQFNAFAERWGLPVNPTSPQKAGTGPIFVTQNYNPWLAGGLLAVLVLLMIAFVRMDWGYRLFKSSHAQPSVNDSVPERMV
ncbi:MAG TPA: poly-gamma-glutamate system protein [Myxococcota bacterium]|nr:poly-gamma-glutamate system protein [Myxococcota bacterium]HPV03043.1 poly-gamma-glutamate system protein [Myxococcota bacterium]